MRVTKQFLCWQKNFNQFFRILLVLTLVVIYPRSVFLIYSLVRLHVFSFHIVAFVVSIILLIVVLLVLGLLVILVGLILLAIEVALVIFVNLLRKSEESPTIPIKFWLNYIFNFYLNSVHYLNFLFQIQNHTVFISLFEYQSSVSPFNFNKRKLN